MKKIFILLVVAVSYLTTNAQNGLNFQGVARNANNVVIASQQISLRFSIIQGSENGTVEYIETRTVKTNSQGLFTAVIGDADVLSTIGSFSLINWKQSPKFLKIEMDPIAGSNFVVIGITQIQSVAYSLYSNGVDASNVAGILPVTKGGTGVGSLLDIRISLALDKVDNTSDANKPISSATQTGLNLKLNIADSNSKYVTPAQLAAKTFDTSALRNDLSLKANIESPNFTGVVSGITKAMVGLGETDNTSDLSKPISGATQAQLDLKENLANKSTNVNLGLSDELYPTQKAVKNYVDGITLTGTPDATTLSKGKIVLAGDLAGTADIPTIALNAVTTDKILNLNVTDAKILSVSGNKITGNILGNAVNVTGNIAVANGGTGAATAAEARTNLGLAIGTNVLAQRSFGTAANKDIENFETPLSISAPLTRVSNTISIPMASASVGGYISATDWTSFNNKINASEKAANNGLASLGSDGKIPSTQIPAISFQSASVVNSQTEMLALSAAVEGSIAIRTDNNLNYVLSRIPATTLSNWIELRTPNTVATVNGFAGPNIELTTNNISEQGANKYFSETLARASVSASAPLVYNAGTGIFSIPAATNGQDGFLSSVDWTSFNNKQTAFGAQTSKTIFAAPAEGDGLPSFRAMQASDVPVLNQNTTGNAASATKLETPRNINGVPFDGTENITITSAGASVITTATTSVADPFDFVGDIDLRGSELDYKQAENIANGVDALGANTSGIANTAFGIRTLKNNTIGTANTAIGFETLLSNTTGQFNTAVGTYSLRFNTTGIANTAFGSTALLFNTEGMGNAAFGEWSLRSNTTGKFNTGLGMNTLYTNTIGYDNLAVGTSALYKNISGNANTALGPYSLLNNTTGRANTAAGVSSLYRNTTGVSNSAFGLNSLFSNTVGNGNTAFGVGSMHRNTTGNNNVAVGANSLYSNFTGQFNTAIGYGADVLTENLSNVTALGNGAKVSTSNTIQLGNLAIQQVNTSGLVNAKAFVINGGTATQFLKANGTVDEREFIVTSEKAAANGLATLDANGKIPSAQIPSISFQSVKVVASESEMLALSSAVEGSIAIRTDNNKSYVLSSIPATTAANWVELRSPGSITSINGESGPNVILTTDKIAEGTNAKYFTTTLAREAITVNAPLVYNSVDGIISVTPATNGSDGYLSSADWNTFNNKQSILTTGTGVNIVDNVVAIGQDVAITATPTFAKLNGVQLGLGAGSLESNTAIGINTLEANTTGEYNTAIGNGALRANTTGIDNASFGSGTLYYNTVGIYNTASGGLALHYNTLGNYNTATGGRSLLNNTTGNYNTAYGAVTMINNKIGNNNTAIGFNAGTSIDGISNSTAIGSQALATASNTIQLGNAAITSVKTSGKLTTGAITYPNSDGLSGQVLATTGAGTLTWTTPQVADMSLLTGVLSISNGGTGASTQNFVDLTTDQSIAGNKSFTSGAVSLGVGNRGANTSSISFPHADDPAFISHYSSGNLAKMRFSVGDDPTTDYFVFGYGAPGSFVEKVKISVDGTFIAPADATINGVKIGMGLGSAVGNTVLGNAALNTNTTGQFNTALGTQSLRLNTTGSANTAIGNEALVNNTTGSLNIAIGASTLLSNTLGYQNTAVGTSAMFANTSGFGNAALGYYSLRSNTTGKENTASGTAALTLNTEGNYNTANGTSALYSNTVGSYNTGIGINASANNISGLRNTSVGAYSLYRNTTGDLNTAIGAYSLQLNNIGANNTTLGGYSMYLNTTGNDNTSLGASALYSHSTGNFNTAVGSNALFYDNTGVKNTAIGYKADVLTGGLTNATAIGSEAVVGASNTIALGNPAVISVVTAGKLTTGGVTYPNTDGFSGQVLSTMGTGTLTWTTVADFVVDLTANQTVGGIKTFSADGVFNGVRIGKGAGSIADNIVLGNAALTLNTSGRGNTAVGDNSLHTNNAGNSNTALGSATLSLNTTGSANTAVGVGALYSNYEGVNNSALGAGALGYNIGGGYNTAMGKNVLYNNTNGSNNVAIGYNTGGGIVNGNNNTIIGANVTGLSDVSNNIIIANGNGTIKARNNGTDWTLTGGVSIGESAPVASAKLEVSSTTQGFLPPRMTKAQRDLISTPASGLTIYNTDSKAFEIFNGTNWYSTVHYVGESYGGGTVFYVYDNGQHGLIASNVTQSTGAYWRAGTYVRTMALADGIGAGKQNTAIIIASQGYGNGDLYAARICNEYSVEENGVAYGDWYLPSKKELLLMCAQKYYLPDFVNNYYWSSTEVDGENAAQVSFNGSTINNTKNNWYHVRAIRSF